ncbi:unnamed protein product [Ceratitis capitata]|uniref:(Mediterranean fruit fly) hypothetical protein n=1 Tax=Ceratitis capitata TaxID=7213 RepID=A0A811UF52_CERCA|nr:unnamed protein product [Ceratitis capitata]
MSRIISLIFAHAPTKEKDDLAKDAFYERLGHTSERCSRHDVKIVLGDFNARETKEDIFGTTVGKFRLHLHSFSLRALISKSVGRISKLFTYSKRNYWISKITQK